MTPSPPQRQRAVYILIGARDNFRIKYLSPIVPDQEPKIILFMLRQMPKMVTFPKPDQRECASLMPQIRRVANRLKSLHRAPFYAGHKEKHLTHLETLCGGTATFQPSPLHRTAPYQRGYVFLLKRIHYLRARHTQQKRQKPDPKGQPPDLCRFWIRTESVNKHADNRNQQRDIDCHKLVIYRRSHHSVIITLPQT